MLCKYLKIYQSNTKLLLYEVDLVSTSTIMIILTETNYVPTTATRKGQKKN